MDELLNRIIVIERIFSWAILALGILGAALLLWFIAWAWMRGRR